MGAPAAPGALFALLSVTSLCRCLAQTGGNGFTQNFLCRENNCINPAFPGLDDLPHLEQVVWECAESGAISAYLDFCKGVVDYSPALPSPNASAPISSLVKAQDDAAATMFFYHLSGMGYDAWDHRTPSASSEPCVRSVWRMVCFTYFPKVQAGCTSGQQTPYLRPCKDTCHEYVGACGVECCDEGLQCVFDNAALPPGSGSALAQSGYADYDGPSAQCTGRALLGLGGSTSGGHGLRAPLLLLLAVFGVHLQAGSAPSAEASRRPRRASPAGLARFALVGALAVCAACLQGCSAQVPHHGVANWRGKADYLVSYEFVPAGQKANASATLNSCADGVLKTQQCGGHGYCQALSASTRPVSFTHGRPVSFCLCDRDWADPECRTRRKSQVTAFLCSLLGGFLGLDYFYLGWTLWGVAKLVVSLGGLGLWWALSSGSPGASLGVFGFWWVLDVVRTGAGPIYARDFRVANDLHHWVYVLSVVSIFMLIGFCWSLQSYLLFRKGKREEMMRLHQSEEARPMPNKDEMDGPRFRSQLGAAKAGFNPHRTYAGYGATLPGRLYRPA